jgi:ribosomal protein L29
MGKMPFKQLLRNIKRQEDKDLTEKANLKKKQYITANQQKSSKKLPYVSHSIKKTKKYVKLTT